MRRTLRSLLVVLLLIITGGLLWGWWVVHRALPGVDGRAVVEGLKQEVTVDRDAWGVPHIRASSVEDMATAQGYVVAQDRFWQMDLLRRAAAGELSEILGPRTLALDRQFRTLGLREAAERDAATLAPEQHALLEAYARGVNAYISAHRGKLPWEFVALRYQPRPWRPADSLLIAGYMYETLASTWRSKLNRAKVTDRVGAARAAELYTEFSPRDHVIVGAEAPSTKAAKHLADAEAPRGDERGTPDALDAHDGGGRDDLSQAAPAVLGKFDEEARAGIGSNNWVVDGSHTTSGKPMLANDTHLSLGLPSIWYLVHLTAPGWNVKGFALPGGPLVIIGHNDRIAWGFTNDFADVGDLYIEKLNPANQHEYLVNGKYVPTEAREERIKVRGQEDVVLHVEVTRHGPIVNREGDRAYALKWTAVQPGAISHAYSLMGRARNWKEFKDTLREVWGPAQNVVYADVDGNIGFIVAAKVPTRRKGNGELPVPGDTDDYEWTGYIPFEELPQVLNPPGGIIATANARVAGPGYPHHLTDNWASPYRTERIYQLLEGKTNLRVADMLAIQTDIVSPRDRWLAGELVRASQAAQAKEPRAHELLARLANWDGRATADSLETGFVEAAGAALKEGLLRPYLGNDINQYQWRSDSFLENVLRERPARWLPSGYRNYDELLVAAADQAAQRLAARTGKSGAADWTWGRLNALVVLHPLGQSGLLQRLLSVGPTPQSGCVYSVKAMGPTHGPAMRMVADLSDWDHSLMLVTTGESGQYGSKHYLDEFPYWFEGREILAPFSEAAEAKARVHTLQLLPSGGR